MAGIVGAGADFLIRGKAIRCLRVLGRCKDGSFTSQIAGRPVRVVDAEAVITTSQGSKHARYRLITSLLDPDLYPALDLVRLYHQRWEIETSYLELKSSMLEGRVLRARTAQGVDQEVYALLCTYQLLRAAISDAALTGPLDPDRGSFTIAWQAARDQVIRAETAITSADADLVGYIGRQILARPLGKRRLRICPRIVKRAISKYQVRGDPDRISRKAKLTIQVLNSEPP
jgi:hypothetical protein